MTGDHADGRRTAPPTSGDDDPTAYRVGLEWPPSRSRLRRSVRWVQHVTVMATVLSALGLVLLVVAGGRGPAVVAGVMLCCVAGGVGLGFGVNLIWWARITRVVRSSPWRRVTVRVRGTPTWWSRGQDDVLYDGDQTAVADRVMFCGDTTPLQRFHGFDVDPLPSPALIAGTGRFCVLTTEAGDLLLPLRGPRTPRQQQRWHHRWRDHLADLDTQISAGPSTQ